MSTVLTCRLAALVLALAACNDFESLSAQHDAGPMYPAYCSSGVTDGDETDLDCGGACAPCELARACTVSKDCQTRTCVDGRCGLTSAPPNWVKVGELVTPSGGFFVGGPDGRLYLLVGASSGGSMSLSAYDPDTAQWAQLAPLDAPASLGAAFGPGGRLYALGAQEIDGTYRSEVRAYTPSTNTWSVEAPLPTLRDWFGAAGDAEHLFVVGGIDRAMAAAAKVDFEIYTAAPAGQFATKPLPAQWRSSYPAATIFDGLLYVMTPDNASPGVYDPALDTWQSAPPMINTRAYFSATVGADQRIYAVGGAGSSRVACEAYDQHGWASTAPLPDFARQSARGRDGRIYALGDPVLPGTPRSLFAYGPQLVLSSTAVPAGGGLLVSGSNFAARAVVSFRWDDDQTAMASAETDDNGVLLSVSVPVAVPAGPHRLQAMDERSRYPVSAPVTVE